jgi:pimeloyl-ACP methyl ester carboxylesterase
VLGESFGSQPAWALLECNSAAFTAEGLILAAGFVKHPWKRGPALLRSLVEITSERALYVMLTIYVRYARFRHRRAPETLTGIHEFVERRNLLDRQAIRHRLVLLDRYDPRPVAGATKIPVYYLAGLVDPIVPYPLVRRWLRKNCPGYRGGRTLGRADHNVLATQPRRAAGQILRWMQSSPAPMDQS